MTDCKLTKQDMTTYHNTKWTKWTLGVPIETSGNGELCGAGWLHYYSHPLLAVMLNPIHADIASPLLHRVKAEGQIKTDRGLKFGCTRLTLIETIPLPVVTATQQVAFGILAARQVVTDPAWLRWADDWLTGKNRSAEAAAEAAAAAWAARAAEAEAAARAARATEARAAAEAALGATTAHAAAAALAAALAVGAAARAWAARAAARAAAEAWSGDPIAIAQEAMTYGDAK